jgi:DtxR family Mn-dependent transcriptional regulator
VPLDTLSAVPAPGEHHPAFEEYCECIYEMHEDNVSVIQARLAERLSVSRASVSEMMKRMEAAGLVDVTANRLQLTAAGETLAVRIVRRHRLAERFLVDVLGLSWSTAHHEACKWEHVITDEVEAGLARLLGNPATCPHGNPIPGAAASNVAITSLDEVPVGSRFTLVRIPEDVEEKDGELASLEAHQIVPGRSCTLKSRRDGAANLVVHDATDREVTLTPFVSTRLLITL